MTVLSVYCIMSVLLRRPVPEVDQRYSQEESKKEEVSAP